MCRLLCVQGRDDFELAGHLDAFAVIARESREYQGHGWGCAWLEDGGWQLYHDITPIWEDPWRPPGRAKLLVAHARSAFRDEGIRVENNMPFTDGERVFVFNGELYGVRIKERGRIGAEKVFNFVKRFDRGDFRLALQRGLGVIEKRTRRIRAMNLIVADRSARVHVAMNFREDPEYFRMHTTESDCVRIICSDPYPESARRGPSGSSGGLPEPRTPAAHAGTTMAWIPLPKGQVLTFDGERSE